MSKKIKPALYYRIRMKYNKWYVLQYDEDISILDDAFGPYDQHSEAEARAETTGLKDLDKSDVPSQTR